MVSVQARLAQARYAIDQRRADVWSAVIKNSSPSSTSMFCGYRCGTPLISWSMVLGVPKGSKTPVTRCSRYPGHGLATALDIPVSKSVDAQVTTRSSLDVITVTCPGVMTRHFPLSLVRSQLRPVTVCPSCNVLTDTDCSGGFNQDAQPVRVAMIARSQICLMGM